MSNYLAFNCFSNKTCQMFDTFPIRYKYQSTSNARLYFPQRIFPNKSLCCMPDLSYLLNKLRNGTQSYVNVPTMRNIITDNHGYIVTVISQSPALLRYDPQNLTLISRTSISRSDLMALTFFNNTYFIGFMKNSILVIDSNNLTILNTINSSSIQGLRAHGLITYNSSRFCASSWTTSLVYCYDALENSTTWAETFVFNSSTIRSGIYGPFVTIDECDRYWFPSYTSFAFIFDSSGSFLGNFSLPTAVLFDILITDNYIMYFVDYSSYSRIIRIDRHIDC
ncbi:hypothetical protein I4U23_021667 [Adineta vaga]|nr:hypothetical protein I4U23_021667 [Adineta vaga]